MKDEQAPVIAIRYPVWSRYWQTVLPGVADYIRMHTRWRLQTEDDAYGEMESVRIDKDWVGAGAILFRATEEELAAFRARGQAVVLTSTEGPDLGYPRVVPDNPAIGRLAADHLLEKGLHHFAFLGRAETIYKEGQFAPGYRRYPRERLKGFAGQLGLHGIEPEVHLLRGQELWQADAWKRIQADAEAFLKRLPKPCWLFVVDDSLGAVALRAAAAAGIKVPRDLAMIGFGDDAMYCLAAVPALSSIIYPGHAIGQLAADLLARQLAGEDCHGVVERVPVGGVVARESSDMVAASDPELAAALAWIHQHAPVSPVTVAELIDSMGVSSTGLAMKFRRALGRSPKQEIMRVRLDRLRSLLATTRVPIASIARVMHFASAHELSRFFLHETGERPSSYRERMAEHRDAASVGAVIFDLDGTLLDTEHLYCRAYIGGMKRCGGRLSEETYFREFIGRDNKHIEETLARTLPKARRAELPSAWRAELEVLLAREGVRVKPGAMETLAALRKAGIRMALASSSDRCHIEAMLDATGMAAYFEVLAAGDEVGAGKPAPDLLVKTARALALLPARCLVVEDSPAGVRAARAAGMEVVMVPDGSGPEADVRALAAEIAPAIHLSKRLLALAGAPITPAGGPPRHPADHLKMDPQRGIRRP
jgi:LacI family transcriptional regulator